MTRIKALLWDVDGTLAETERDGHRVAFNRAFEACGLPWRWDEARYGELLRITGGRERLWHDMQSRADAPVLMDERSALVATLHRQKNAIYADLIREAGVPLRPGVMNLMRQCRQEGVLMGIATTTSRVNVDALLRVHLGPQWAGWFAAVVCGEDVRHKKPDPEVYQTAMQAMGVGPLDCVAIEDSPGGVAAARAVDIPVVVTQSSYFGGATIEGAIAIGPGLGTRHGWRPGLRGAQLAGEGEGVDLDDIRAWRAQMETVSQYE